MVIEWLLNWIAGLKEDNQMKLIIYKNRLINNRRLKCKKV